MSSKYMSACQSGDLTTAIDSIEGVGKKPSRIWHPERCTLLIMQGDFGKTWYPAGVMSALGRSCHKFYDNIKSLWLIVAVAKHY